MSAAAGVYFLTEDFGDSARKSHSDLMREDEANFLDSSSIKVVFTEGKVVMIDPSSPPVAP